jgi:hypothetical protein
MIKVFENEYQTVSGSLKLDKTPKNGEFRIQSDKTDQKTGARTIVFTCKNAVSGTPTTITCSIQPLESVYKGQTYTKLSSSEKLADTRGVELKVSIQDVHATYEGDEAATFVDSPTQYILPMWGYTSINLPISCKNITAEIVADALSRFYSLSLTSPLATKTADTVYEVTSTPLYLMATGDEETLVS